MGIPIVFVLIVMTNLIYENNFVRVRDTVVTIYEDKVASDLLFDLSNAIQEKEMAVASTNTAFFLIIEVHN
ncbi:MAG: hypothetical protein ACJA1H_000957 [Glaciecola sp.]